MREKQSFLLGYKRSEGIITSFLGVTSERARRISCATREREKRASIHTSDSVRITTLFVLYRLGLRESLLGVVESLLFLAGLHSFSSSPVVCSLCFARLCLHSYARFSSSILCRNPLSPHYVFLEADLRDGLYRPSCNL